MAITNWVDLMSDYGGLGCSNNAQTKGTDSNARISAMRHLFFLVLYIVILFNENSTKFLKNWNK